MLYTTGDCAGDLKSGVLADAAQAVQDENEPVGLSTHPCLWKLEGNRREMRYRESQTKSVVTLCRHKIAFTTYNVFARSPIQINILSTNYFLNSVSFRL